MFSSCSFYRWIFVKSFFMAGSSDKSIHVTDYIPQFNNGTHLDFHIKA